jgi:aspartyl aminopeptidase
LINSTKNTSESLCNDPNVRLITLFDNEEVGSTTAHGANSSLLETTLKRICGACAKTCYDVCIYLRFFFSFRFYYKLNFSYYNF